MTQSSIQNLLYEMIDIYVGNIFNNLASAYKNNNTHVIVIMIIV